MAAALGFQIDHYDVSIKAGERVLLPAVRHADKDTLIIADGFSCREQIAQTTDRQALHLAQVLQMALRRDELAGVYPERLLARNGHEALNGRHPALRTAAVVAGGALVAGGLALWARKHTAGR